MLSPTPLLVLSLCGVALSGVVRADDGLLERANLAVSTAHGTALGAGANDAPRAVRIDTPAEPQRSAPGLRGETTELGYRWWASRGRADLGLGLGTMSYVTRPTGSVPGLEGSSGVMASGTVLTLGMRYRTSDRSALFADAAGLRGGYGIQGNDGVVGKVGIEFKSAQSRWNIAYGGLGLRLADDARMTLRVRRGGLGVYMHSSF